MADSLAFALLATPTFQLAGTQQGVYKSTNQGTSWSPANSGLPPGQVRDLSLVNGTTVVTMDSGIYRSTDNGAFWSPASAGIAPDAGIALALLAYGGNLFASTGLGRAYVSTNGGVSWGDISTGLLRPGSGLSSLAVANGYLFGGASSGGVWRRSLSEIVAGVEEGNEFTRASQYVLMQNYPNPFNPATVIRYALPQTSAVSLTVHTILGQLVSELVSGVQEQGVHEVRFDGSALASGVYFYRLTASLPAVRGGGMFIDTKKLLILR
jgi:hypothetical protein